MIDGFDPRTEYRLKLINLCLTKDLPSDIAQEIVDRLTSLPEGKREETAKQLYEIVSESNTEQEISQKIREMDS